MTLFDPNVEIHRRPKAWTYAVMALVIVFVIASYFLLRYYPEKRAAMHFFDAVVAGQMDEAYQLWKPGPSYTKKDFLADFGPEGYYGPIKSYRIIRTRSPRGASGVIVSTEVSPFAPMPDKSDVEKSGRTKLVTIWVESKDKSFSFPPDLQ